jgi:putative transposase
LRSGWSLFATRLAQKAAGRVEYINPAFTSQRCSACGTIDRQARESQAVWRCRSCGYAANADRNAARNIAAGHAVSAQGDLEVLRSMNCEPQHVASSAA